MYGFTNPRKMANLYLKVPVLQYNDVSFIDFQPQINLLAYFAQFFQCDGGKARFQIEYSVIFSTFLVEHLKQFIFVVIFGLETFGWRF